MAALGDSKFRTMGDVHGAVQVCSRLHQRYARLTGRSVNLGYTSLGIVVTAATPAELVAATDAVVAEATRKQPLLRDRLDYRSINSLG